jgi:hypothetical protein
MARTPTEPRNTMPRNKTRQKMNQPISYSPMDCKRTIIPRIMKRNCSRSKSSPDDTSRSETSDATLMSSQTTHQMPCKIGPCLMFGPDEVPSSQVPSSEIPPLLN